MESSLGAITVDIGKVKTSLAFILDNQLIAFDEISLGTYNFSKDLSQIFTISINDAELLRKKIDKLDFTKEINKKDVESFKVYESRAKELINLIFYQIKKSKFHSLVDNNIILTGYGSRSLLINKMIKNKFNLSNCRLGSSQKINGIKLVTENPSLSSSFGLLSYAADHDLELDGSNNFEKKESIFSIIYNFFKAI
jgi:cell division ATPase FtsA